MAPAASRSGLTRSLKILTAPSGAGTSVLGKRTASQLAQGANDALPLPPSLHHEPIRARSTLLDLLRARPVPKRAVRKRATYAARARSAFAQWVFWLPRLEIPYLSTFQSAPSSETLPIASCPSSCSHRAAHSVRVISLGAVRTITFQACPSHLVAAAISAKLVPANTQKIHTAFSFDLIRFFRALQRHSRLGAHGFVKALFDFQMAGPALEQSNVIRKQLNRAAVWMDLLDIRARTRVHQRRRSDARGPLEPATLPSTELPEGPEAFSAQVDPDLHLSCSHLAQRCPACFGGLMPSGRVNTGLPTASPDVIVCLDGNFTHKRRRRNDAVKESPSAPSFFLSQQQVEDAAKRFIAAAKSNGPATGCSSKVKAAVDGAVKASKGAYDVVGLIGMTCRHGSPLLMCDVRDSGESHFYAFALIEHLLYACEGRISSLGVCYDIGCKLAVSPRMRKALASSALLAALRPFPSPKITFVVSLFHVYGHDLDCQLKYSPRRNVGYGLTDGESLERLWSALADQISVTRNMSLVGRQHTLSSHLAFLVREHLMRSASMLESRRARVDAERIKAAPKIVAAVISVAHHASTPAALPSPNSAVPNGFPAAHVNLVPGFASLSLRRQSEALARGAARRKRTSGDALTRSAKRLYTFVSQVHALESWIKRRGNVASQKATERLVTAKRTAVQRSKRTLLEVNDAIKVALVQARAPVQNALKPILEADVLKADTLTQLARYGDFVDRAQDPWFLDDNLSQGLDAYELLVRCDEEHSRIRLEQENIRTWIARTITHLEGSRYASRVPGWTELVVQELSRFRALYAWWDRPTSGSAAAEATVATGDGFDTDDDSDDDFAEAEDSSALSAKANAPETKDSSDIPPSTGDSPRGDHSNSGHQAAISEQVWDRTSLADAERDDLDVSDNEFDKKWGGVEDGKTEAEAKLGWVTDSSSDDEEDAEGEEDEDLDD